MRIDASTSWLRTWAKTERLLVAAVLVIGLFATYSRTAHAMKIQDVTSPGGIKAWLVEQHSVPLITLRFAFEGGSAQDPVGKEGVANFLTSMMDEGAGDLDARAFQERMEEIAMKMSFDDDPDNLYATFQTLTANRTEAVALLKLVLASPRFDADAVDRIKSQLQASLAFAAKDPNQVAGKAFASALFPGHPYGRPSSGTPESVKAITRDDLLAYKRRVFARDTLKIAVVGDIDAKALGLLLDEVFGALPAKADLVAVPKVMPKVTGAIDVRQMPVPQSVAMFGLPGIARKDPDFMAAFVLNHILGGGGFSSRLMTEVREKRGLAYSVYSYLQTYQQAALFAGGVATKNEEIGRSIDVIRGELKRLADDGPSSDELAGAKSYLIGSYALRFDTSSKIASQLLGVLVEDLGKEYIETRNAQIDRVTLDDVKRVARGLLKSDALHVTVVGQPQGLAARPGG